MSNVSTTTQKTLSAKAHNVLFGLQGLIWVVAAMQNDLTSILSTVQGWIPMVAPFIAGLIHLYQQEKASASKAFSAGKSANITQTAAQALTVVSNANADVSQIKAVATQLINAVHAAES